MPSVSDVCPACKRPVADHLPSTRYAPDEAPPGKVVVVNGRCIVGDERASQKCCWVQLHEPMTPAEYRQRFDAGTILLEPCPCCGGRLTPWGSFSRKLAEVDPPWLEGLRLLRGWCPNPDCTICTVTHYPCFATPYHTAPTALREAVVRAHVEEGVNWETLAQRVPWSVASLQRWQARIAERAVEVVIGLTAVRQRLDPRAPASLRSVAGRRGLLQAMFGVCGAVRDLLAEREGWTVPVPGLAVPRIFRPPAPTTLPVWT